LGKDFDPQFHEALAHIPSYEKENIIVAVIQNGYSMNNKIIRPARVAVSNGEKPKEKNKK
jgi:molecular chaperone GrpE